MAFLFFCSVAAHGINKMLCPSHRGWNLLLSLFLSFSRFIIVYFSSTGLFREALPVLSTAPARITEGAHEMSYHVCDTSSRFRSFAHILVMSCSRVFVGHYISTGTEISSSFMVERFVQWIVWVIIGLLQPQTAEYAFLHGPCTMCFRDFGGHHQRSCLEND